MQVKYIKSARNVRIKNTCIANNQEFEKKFIISLFPGI